MATQEELTKSLRSLSRFEAQVLYLRCLGHTVENTAKILNYSEETINKTMAGIYTVFGFKKDAGAKTRIEALRHFVCPFYSTFLGGYTVKLDDPIWDDWPDINIPRAITPIDLDMVILDNQVRKDTEIIPRLPQPGELLTIKEPIIHIPPPPPPPPPTGTPWWMYVLLVGAGLVILYLLVIRPTAQPVAPTLIVSPSPEQEIAKTVTEEPTKRPTITKRPTHTPTSSITSTPVPFPITENFSEMYSDLWWIIGDPVVATKVEFSNFDGVISPLPGESFTMMIGNEAWKDYVVTFRATILSRHGLRIGVRVKDVVNMVAFDCPGARDYCRWKVIIDNKEEDMPLAAYLDYELGKNTTITVKGDLYSLVTADGNDYTFTMPLRYRDIFSGGGVLFHMEDEVAVDYINIQKID